MNCTTHIRLSALATGALLLVLGAACSSEKTPPGGSGKDAGTNTGTDGGGNADGGTMTGAFNPSQLAARLAQAQCAFASRCQPFFLQYAGQTEAKCTTEGTADFTRNFTFLAAAITAGRVRYSSQAADACTAAFGSADCILGLADECDGLFTGQQGMGQPCSTGAECGANLYCTARTGQCGTCAPTVTLGQPCDAAPCGDHLTCVQVDQMGNTACVPDNAQEGGTCLTVQTGFCRGALQCVGDMTSTCQRPAAQGATCDAMQTTAPNCNVAVGQACLNATCGAASIAAIGAACDPTMGSYCNADGYCPQGGMCAALPQAGSPCIGNPPDICGTDAYCSNGNCAPQKPGGQACAASLECQGAEAFCIFADGATMGTCGPLTWRQCN
ncbi:MAG: hypothetical protein IT384_29680 [Deltaproteobacteria bacterium]|nr:hypothetical protein [Deltaproteobacteria bacterium]